MGEPVKIIDLAKEMIKFYGYEVNKDIDINHIKANSVATIYVSNLKIAGNNKENGIYLIDTESRHYKIETIASNRPTKMVIIIPEIPRGIYQLVIITQYSQGTILIKPREGYYIKSLISI